MPRGVLGAVELPSTHHPMPFACARALRLCALLALPASAFAQSPRTPTVFSATTQLGTVNLRAAVVLTDYTVKPLPLLKVVAIRSDRPDSVAGETDLDGRAVMSLRVGTYTLKAKTSQPVGGRSYSWSVRVVVRAQRTEQVQLTNSNASISDSVASTAVVAAAPQPATPAMHAPVAAAVTSPKPATTAQPGPSMPVEKVVAVAKPAQPRPTEPVDNHNKVVPRANTSGIILGLSFDASSIQSDDLTSSRESGLGLAGQLGWGFGRHFALLVDMSGARISSLSGDFDLAHADVSARWHFVNRSAFVPYLQAGYGGRAATRQDAILSDGAGNTYTGDLSILGSGISAGGGFEYFATPGLALGGSLTWTSGKFTRVQFDRVTVDGLSIDATSARFNMGFAWYPMR